MPIHTASPVPPTETPTATVTPVPTATPLAAPLASALQITGVERLQIDEGGESAELAPDGEAVAWIVPAQADVPAQLCVEKFAGTGRRCTDLPGYAGLPYRLAWSPDSRWIAFTEDPAAQALESDIWIVDAGSGELVRRTDDTVVGAIEAAEPGSYVLDYLPMWHPVSGDLYFWRSTMTEQGERELALMRLDPASSEAPQLVRTLGEELGVALVPFGVQRFYLDGPSAIAPDGSQLAVVTAPTQEMNLSPSNGLWLIDLNDPTKAPVQMATSAAWQEALPVDWSQPAVARGLAWTGDSQGIVVAALSNDLRLPLLTAHYVAVDAGLITPVVDFSTLPDRAAFFEVGPGQTRPLRYDVPLTLALPRDANVLLLVNDLGGITRIAAVGLPPDGRAPQVLVERVSREYDVLTRSSSSAEGEVLVYGLLLTVEAAD